jgi:hypothetical protein
MDLTQLKNYAETTRDIPKEINAQQMMAELASAVNIPEKHSRKYRIEHEIIKQGTPVTLISMRNAILMGYKSLNIIFDTDLKIHKLKSKDGGLLMSDHPQEIFLAHEGLKAAHGVVLMGGLGLGYAATKLAQRKDISRIYVIEIDKEIIKLVKPHLGPKITVINESIYTFLRCYNYKVDYVFLDTWYQTGESTYWDTVFPLRILARKRFVKSEKDIFCWGEEEMLGQVKTSMCYILSGDMKPWNKALYAVHVAIIRKLTKSDGLRDIPTVVNKFFTDIGSKEWEKEWHFSKCLKIADKNYKEQK